MLGDDNLDQYDIWNLISMFISNFHGEAQSLWYLIIKFSGNFYKIRPYLADDKEKRFEKKDIDDLKTFGFEPDDKDITKRNENLIIPINFKENTVFYVIIRSDNITIHAKILKFMLESLVRQEANDLLSYPSFLPFIFLSDQPEIDLINTKIQQKSNYFFLNGVQGTGKHTFIKNHLMYCYGINTKNMNISKKFEKGKIQNLHRNINNFIIVNELAYCTEGDQLQIIDHISDQDQNNIAFICSAYDPLVLFSRGVIGEELKEFCVNNRIIFPSIQKKIKSLREIIYEYFLFKGIKMPEFFSDHWVNKQLLGHGIEEFLLFIQEYYKSRSPLIALFENRQSLRDQIKEIEILAIDYAIRIIGKSQNKISKYLGISRGSLQHKLKKYNYLNKEWED